MAREHKTPVERYKQLYAQFRGESRTYAEMVDLTGISLAHVKNLLFQLEKVGCVTRTYEGKFVRYSWVDGVPLPTEKKRKAAAVAPASAPRLDPISAAMFPGFRG